MTMQYNATTVTIDAKAFPISYHIAGDNIYALVTVGSQAMCVLIMPTDADYKAALAAATDRALPPALHSEPAKKAAKRAKVNAEAVTPEPVKPVKAAKEPAAPKIDVDAYKGTTRTGAYYSIVFDAAIDRVRIILDDGHEAAKRLVEDAKFYYSRVTQSIIKASTIVVSRRPWRLRLSSPHSPRKRPGPVCNAARRSSGVFRVHCAARHSGGVLIYTFFEEGLP